MGRMFQARNDGEDEYGASAKGSLEQQTGDDVWVSGKAC